MIILQRGNANEVTLTLTEKVSLSSPNFLFEFTNQESNESFYCIAADTSIYPESYNQFTITENNSPDALNGEITLVLQGRYSYIVREQVSATNLDPNLSGGIVERGLCKVTISDAVNPTYTTDRTNVVYNG